MTEPYRHRRSNADDDTFNWPADVQNKKYYKTSVCTSGCSRGQVRVSLVDGWIPRPPPHPAYFLELCVQCWNWAKLRKTCSSEIWLTQ